MSTLKKQAEDLGIEVNPRWSDETLKKKIDEAKEAQDDAKKDNAPFGGKGDHDGDGTPGGSAPPLAQTGAPVADDGTPLKTEETPKATKAKVELDVKTRLTITAEELNIEVDEEWDEDRLRAEIQQAREGRADLQVKGAVPKPETAAVDYDPATRGDKEVKSPYTLLRDYWDEEGERIPAGTDLSFTDSEARRLGPEVLKPKGVF
jgi:hypothetical protein